MENKNPRPPCFLLVLDTAMSAEELQDAKDSLGQLVALLPEECLVGLITFGATVTVHELCEHNAFPKSYVLRGTDDVTQEQLKKLLGLELSASEYASYDKQRGSAVAEASNALRRFILPVSECEFALQTALDELRPDPFPREQGTRPFRATGVAVAAAQGLIAECHSAQGARVMVFTSGPCTIGPGSIVGRDMSETMRTHQDFNKGDAKHYKAASKFYNQIGIRLATHAHTLDVFACSLDQVGLAEMKTAVDQTGGVMVLAEQFGADAFRSSLRRMFARDSSGALDMYFNATFSVFCTPQVMVCGGIGPMSALAVKSKSISENEVGMGQTTSWRVCSLNSNTSVAVYYEIVNQHSNPIPSGTPFYLQFCVRYKRSNGEIRLRVMTVARRWAESSSSHDVVSGACFFRLFRLFCFFCFFCFFCPLTGCPACELCVFILCVFIRFRPRGGGDAGGAGVHVSHRTRGDVRLAALAGQVSLLYISVLTAIRMTSRVCFVYRTLIRVGTKFGEYAKDAPETFRMPGPFAIYPQFMFNLRRSQFLQTANNTPDETAFYRLMMGRETVLNSLVMIQPTLMSYTFNGPPTPVLLDVASIQPDCILLLDTFFMIVVHAGSTIGE